MIGSPSYGSPMKNYQTIILEPFQKSSRIVLDDSGTVTILFSGGRVEAKRKIPKLKENYPNAKFYNRKENGKLVEI